MTRGGKALSEEAVSKPGKTRLLPNHTAFSSQCKGWAESTCRCGCETGSKMCFQSLFMSSRDHTQGNWSKPEMWELLVFPLFLCITISKGAVASRRNWNRSFHGYLRERLRLWRKYQYKAGIYHHSFVQVCEAALICLNSDSSGSLKHRACH